MSCFIGLRFESYLLARKSEPGLDTCSQCAPNLLLVDEFCAHLDPATAMRVARRIAQVAREHRITLVAVTHRPEVLNALQPDMIYAVGYGTFVRLDDLPSLGLRVLEPYATYIISGKKKWELRKQPTNVRGRIGIVSGDRLIGTVEVTSSHGPYSVDELKQLWHKHLADPTFLERYAGNRKLYVWELANPVSLTPAIPVRLRKGHQVWMQIEPAQPRRAPEKGENETNPGEARTGEH